MLRLFVFTMLLAALCSGCVSAPKNTSAQGLALANGNRLALKSGKVVLAAKDGSELSSLKLRAKALDVRDDGAGAIAVAFDGNEQRPLLLRVTDNKIAVERELAPVNFSLTSECLYRDAQGLLHLFLIANDGLAEQWLLSGSEPRLFRRLALPPGVKNCRADDNAHVLYVEETGYGVWAYAGDGEGVPSRRFVGKSFPENASKAVEATPMIVAQAQTAAVARSGDAADDPAIWVHPVNTAQSLIIATNKKQGLLSYDLQGRQKQLLESGRLNNVDLRQNIHFSGERVDLAIATQRDEHGLVVFEIDAKGSMREASLIVTGLSEVYGTCLYQPASGGLEVFVNDKDGRFEQYRIVKHHASYSGQLVRSFRAQSQPEGCVVDDRNGRLFFGEEDVGIWTLSADADAKDAKPALIIKTGKVLVADVEGLAIYRGKNASYLVASSQGNSTYVVLDALPPFKVRGAVRVGINADAGIDGTSDTDGLEASAVNFGGAYAEGMLVVQDGYKRLPDGTQNFKYIAWRDIARALNLDR